MKQIYHRNLTFQLDGLREYIERITLFKLAMGINIHRTYVGAWKTKKQHNSPTDISQHSSREFIIVIITIIRYTLSSYIHPSEWNITTTGSSSLWDKRQSRLFVHGLPARG